MLKEFQEFISKGNVMDLAVGVIIGAAFGMIVNSLVDDIIMPIIGAIFGGLRLLQLFPAACPPAVNATSLAEAKKQGAVFAYGNFLTVVLNFLILAWIIFLMVKAVNRSAPAAAKRRSQPRPPLAAGRCRAAHRNSRPAGQEIAQGQHLWTKTPVDFGRGFLFSPAVKQASCRRRRTTDTIHDPDREFARRGPCRARKRHRRRRELRPRPRRPDPALGRRGRPADARLHHRCRCPGAGRRRDLLHLAERHPRTEAGARPLLHQAFRQELRRGRVHRHRLAACRRSSWRSTLSPARATRSSICRRPGRISPPPPVWPAPSRSRSRSTSPAMAGPATSTRSRRRSRQGPRRCSSTRRPTRPAGPPTGRRCRRSSTSPAKRASGSSPTRSMRCSTTATAARRPSSTSWPTRTASCSSTVFPRTGR